MMKRITALIVLLLLTVTAGCGRAGNAQPDIDSIKYYTDIPGVTQEDIYTVEMLKAEMVSFSYGHLIETEALRSPYGGYKSFPSEVCGLLSELFGIPFAEVPYESWQLLKADVDNRAIDFTGDLTPTPARTREYYLTSPIADHPQRIYTVAGSDNIMTEADVDGLRLGFLKNSVNIEPILRHYPALSFEAVYVDSILSVEERLLSGEIDAFVSEKNLEAFFGDGKIQSRDFFPLAYTSVSLATADPRMEPVISVFEKYLAAGGLHRLNLMYKESEYDYKRLRLARSFTAEERAYLADLSERGATVPIGVDHDNYPISFYKETEYEFQGIALDTLHEIGNLTGIEFQIANPGDAPWPEINDDLIANRIALVPHLVYSDARAEYSIWTEVPYAVDKYVLISRSDYPPAENYQIPRLRVRALSRSIYEDIYYDCSPAAVILWFIPPSSTPSTPWKKAR